MFSTYVVAIGQYSVNSNKFLTKFACSLLSLVIKGKPSLKDSKTIGRDLQYVQC